MGTIIWEGDAPFCLSMTISNLRLAHAMRFPPLSKHCARISPNVQTIDCAFSRCPKNGERRDFPHCPNNHLAAAVPAGGALMDSMIR